MNVPGFLESLDTLTFVKRKSWQWKAVTIAHHVYESKDSEFTKKQITDLVGDGQWVAQLLGEKRVKRPEAAFLLRNEGSNRHNSFYTTSLRLNESDFEAR
jgi:hypothetical protein